MTRAKGDPEMTADDRLIVALDVPNVVQGLELAARIGDAASFYKIGLGMLTGGGLALANELKQEQGKRIFLDMKLFDIGATVEAAVRGFARFDLDLLTVQGDPQVVQAAMQGSAGSGLRILAVTILTSLDRADLDANMIRAGDLAEITLERAARALEAGADGVIRRATRSASPHRARRSATGPITSWWAARSGRRQTRARRHGPLRQTCRRAGSAGAVSFR